MTVDDLLTERGNTYGSFADNGRIAQALKDIVRSGPRWEHLDDIEREALDMICSKISRIVSGKLHFPDNWRDVIGYATLALNEINERESK